MRLLPKSIHRCHRYPTKFNSGRDIPEQRHENAFTPIKKPGWCAEMLHQEQPAEIVIRGRCLMFKARRDPLELLNKLEFDLMWVFAKCWIEKLRAEYLRSKVVMHSRRAAKPTLCQSRSDLDRARDRGEVGIRFVVCVFFFVVCHDCKKRGCLPRDNPRESTVKRL